MLAKAAGPTGDPFKAAVIDTIVAEVQSTAGEDRCVLLLGYKDQMEEMFRDVNPGLARRFPLESAFVFEDFNDAEIRQIFDFKLKEIGFDATDQGKRVRSNIRELAPLLTCSVSGRYGGHTTRAQSPKLRQRRRS